MVYTITFNPSIDYFMSLDNLTVGQLNRSAVEFFKAGGKGINVSQILTNLDLNNIALGFQPIFFLQLVLLQLLMHIPQHAELEFQMKHPYH